MWGRRIKCLYGFTAECGRLRLPHKYKYYVYCKCTDFFREKQVFNEFKNNIVQFFNRLQFQIYVLFKLVLNNITAIQPI